MIVQEKNLIKYFLQILTANNVLSDFEKNS